MLLGRSRKHYRHVAEDRTGCCDERVIGSHCPMTESRRCKGNTARREDIWADGEAMGRIEGVLSFAALVQKILI